jgi:serine/threonine protein kinase, bacterial
MPLAEGATFAGYTIVRILGSGGMGDVYLAEHPRLPRLDAIKVLPADVSGDEAFRERFNREADLAAKPWHPHIVGVHDRGEYEGQLWIAMDFVDGTDAQRLLVDRYPAGMPADEVAAIVTAVAGALDYAHKRDLLHRDVKPANIMLADLDDDGGEQRILLTDFGIARNIDDISGLTTTNMAVGTVAYSAPEQLMGEQLDGRADQYALAATAYHLLTGSHLFAHSNPAVVISRHLNTPAPALADVHAQLAPLDPIMGAALAKNPDDRFPGCLDFARALAETAAPHAKRSTAAPTTPAQIASRAATESPPPHGQVVPNVQEHDRSSKRWLIPTVAVAVLVLIGAIALAWRPWQLPNPANTATPTYTAPPATTAPVPPAISSLAPPPAPLTTTTTTPAAASGPTLGEPCTDWDKLAYDRNAGENLGLIVCGANTSPAAQFEWVEAPIVTTTRVAGTACPGVTPGTMARSTDDYLIFCMGNQLRAYLPGGRTISPASEPIWQLYSP